MYSTHILYVTVFGHMYSKSFLCSISLIKEAVFILLSQMLVLDECHSCIAAQPLLCLSTVFSFLPFFSPSAFYPPSPTLQRQRRGPQRATYRRRVRGRRGSGTGRKCVLTWQGTSRRTPDTTQSATETHTGKTEAKCCYIKILKELKTFQKKNYSERLNAKQIYDTTKFNSIAQQ